MKKIAKKELFEIHNFYEETSFNDLPYSVERIEENDEIIWLGLEKNWKYSNNKWFVLIKQQWEEMNEEPIYEKLYKENL